MVALLLPLFLFTLSLSKGEEDRQNTVIQIAMVFSSVSAQRVVFRENKTKFIDQLIIALEISHCLL
jgi:hypothetical protein